MTYLLGIDIGTTAVKGMIIDMNGQVMVKSNIPYNLLLPHPGWAEQDPEEMWMAVKQAISAVLNEFSGNRGRIAALSLSTQRDTLICTDKHGKPVRNAITWMDSRSVCECTALEREFGAERIYEITGVGISTIWTFSFLLWLRRHEPDHFSETTCFGLVHDFILFRLGAAGHFLDTSNACQTMLFDFQKNVWSEELMEYGGLDAERLPVLVAPGTPVGRLSPSLAAEFGLSPDLVLVSGGGDQQCAALGAGAVCEGDVEVGIGTAANVLAVTETPRIDPLRRMVCHRAAENGKWVLEGAMLATGKLIEWMRETVFCGVSLSEIDREVADSSSPGASGLVVLPHFEGAACPYWNPQARGVIAGLTLSSSRADLARAFLESISFEIRKCVDLLRLFGVLPEKIWISGGASRSSVWMQILADVLGVQIEIAEETDCAALGAALLAGVGCGLFPTAQWAAEKAVRCRKTFLPNDSLRKQYDQLYQKNQALYQTFINFLTETECLKTGNGKNGISIG